MTEHPADDAALAVPQLVVPAYFHPATHPREWEWLAQHSARVRLVILNLANGPGTQPDQACLPALGQLRAAGVCVCGYVDTNYGQRHMDEALADLRRHVEWYRVDGVFFDRAASGPGQLGYYAELARRAREAGARLIALNHGAHPVEAYADHADLLGTFEGPWGTYIELGVPRWVRSRPDEQFFHLVHSVPAASMADAWWLAAHRHAGCAYVTDRDGDNPWDGLPAGELAATTPLARALAIPRAGSAGPAPRAAWPACAGGPAATGATPAPDGGARGPARGRWRRRGRAH